MNNRPTTKSNISLITQNQDQPSGKYSDMKQPFRIDSFGTLRKDFVCYVRSITDGVFTWCTECINVGRVVQNKWDP